MFGGGLRPNRAGFSGVLKVERISSSAMIGRRERVARHTAVVVVAGLLAAGCGSESPSNQTSDESSARAAAPHPEQALIEGLVLASRMLARPELDVMGAQGHVSVRSQRDPSHYYIA